ncbi:AI-2E family transporter [Rhodovibrio salinarum]|uniref:AI-2E family transporter n=1 Tax=Rhodovibrio salinarum TaxID=1087 RepID=A0A934QH12_9PROT|nr:AI-2E family transporter [Rhodovibrio salinarum]MBK1696395.1 AI-2E family transporter [Rhodovibrio salinarum]
MRDKATIWLAVLASAAAIYFARGFLLPIFLAGFLAIVLRPAVTRLHALRVPETLAAALIVLAFLGMMFGALYSLAAPLQEWADRLPRLTAELKFRFAAVQQSIEQMRDIAQQIEEMTQDGGGKTSQIQASGSGAPDLVGIVIDRTRSAFVTLLTMLVLLFFLLSQGTHLSKRFVEILPDAWHRESGNEMLLDLRQQIAVYLRTFTLINIGFGVLVWLSMTVLGLPDAILWGVMAALLNFLPYIGPLIMVILIGTAALLESYTWTGIILPPVVYAGLNVIEGNLVTPHLLGRQLTLNPVVIFVSVLFWTWAWGAIGAILAVPVLAVIRIVAEYVPPMRRLLPILQ